MFAASGAAKVIPESSWKRRIAVVVGCCSEELREEQWCSLWKCSFFVLVVEIL